ncbi:MAG: phosphatidylserine decarboxylase family protein [Phycisphaeraceae bacterium]|nr:phosphatidylserine decarboxylase family protein [Phycisphaeraceae bacterium]
MLLTPYGAREWLTISAIAFALGALFIALAWWIPLAILAVLWLAVLSFFRDPFRRIPGGLAPGDMLSPADGVVSAIERVDQHRATGGPAVVVRIFLSVLNVHVNRAPFDGTVRALHHTPGKFLNAQTPESARVNEANLITMEIIGGETIGIRQVAGMIARRIVCPLRVGDRLARGDRFGMIKFGSTTELILPRPDDVRVHVAVGQRVRGGLTLLATLPPR